MKKTLILQKKENSLNLIGVQLGEGLNWVSGVSHCTVSISIKNKIIDQTQPFFLG
jgi:hypothetical protein